MRHHDLTAIVNDVLGVVRHMSRYSDRIVRFNRTTPCFLEINGPEIQQVVMNLVSNGLEAMDAGGTMTIAIVEQTDQVTLSFTDDGCGMTPQVIENLFEPFFTQRRNGQGTGLGLSISHRIVADHGGAIEVESDGPGKGSTFRVRLPPPRYQTRSRLNQRPEDDFPPAAGGRRPSRRPFQPQNGASTAAPSRQKRAVKRAVNRIATSDAICYHPASHICLTPKGFGSGAPRRGLLEHIARQ